MCLRGEVGDRAFLGDFLEVLLLRVFEGEREVDRALAFGVADRPFLSGLSDGDRGTF